MANKRGRKRKNDLYFGPDQEAAVVRFLESDDIIERNKIYNEFLREPLNKMSESIIRKYKLYRKGLTFEEIQHDALSFLITKADKFDKTTGKKSYSYYGTIIKHYLLGAIIKDDKSIKQLSSYEDVYGSLEGREDLTYTIDDNKNALEEFIRNISESIKKEMDMDYESEIHYDNNGKKKKKLTDNEYKVGYALIEILDNWEALFDNNLDGSPKYNKNQFYATVRENTHLTTKDIRNSMKRYKDLYNLLKEDKIDEGML